MTKIWDNMIGTIAGITEEIKAENPGMDDDTAFDEASRVNDEYLDEDPVNGIDIGSDIVVIANLGLWDEPKMAYRIIKGGKLKDCRSAVCGEYWEWFVDDSGDLMINDYHHDGTNVYRFREWNKEIKPGLRDVFLHVVAHGLATEDDIEKFTLPIGHYVMDKYKDEFGV